MNGYLSADDFLTGIVGGEEDIELTGIGKVRIRSLEALEIQQIRAQAADDEMQMSFLAVLQGLVEPELSADHLSAIQRAKPGIIAILTRRIMEISGMGEDFEKKVGIGS